MSNIIWTITAKTNLHVGNENTSSYGLIDLAVQRNATTQLPCINSSSLKGALNEFAANAKNEDNEPILNEKQLISIFGSDKKKRSTKTEKGGYTFYDANILFLPKQDDKELYKMTTSIGVLQRFVEMMNLFKIKLVFFDLVKKGFDKEQLESELKKEFGLNKNVAILSNEEFSENCNNENLPIIARNILENGESKNLWYEQVIPSESVFYTIIDDNDDENKIIENLLTHNTFVQIGANATIGYGYCLFKNITPEENGNNK